jgi:membrane associated rhomboid family serine protease
MIRRCRNAACVAAVRDPPSGRHFRSVADGACMLANIPPICRALLISNGIVFLLQIVAEMVFVPFMLWPVGDYPIAFIQADGMRAEMNVGFMPWQLVTYGFMHGGFAHLFFNMFALVMFGSDIERLWGSRRFAIYFFTCLVGAGLIQLFVATMAAQPPEPHMLARPYPTIGASGGTFGLLLAFGMMFPHRQVLLLIPPIPMKARTLVIGFGALELLMGITRTQSGIAHFAHLGGMLFGFLLIQYWRGRWPFVRR